MFSDGEGWDGCLLTYCKASSILELSFSQKLLLIQNTKHSCRAKQIGPLKYRSITGWFIKSISSIHMTALLLKINRKESRQKTIVKH